jgi:hypothetical protein
MGCLYHPTRWWRSVKGRGQRLLERIPELVFRTALPFAAYVGGSAPDWSRILSKEYERTAESSESNIYLASIRLMLRRLVSSPT